jgi:predicted lipid-binding transport protein (Tim44 family)
MDTPQFRKAEYAGAQTSEQCRICSQPVGATYYRVNGALSCSNCAAQAKAASPGDSHSNFMRGLLFGIGGAILGLIVYSTFSIATGIEIGYVSLAVGFIVGKAVKMGSNGLGGSRYQIAAVILTYAAVSMAAVPIAISQDIKQDHARRAASAQISAPPSTSSISSPAASGNADPNSSPRSNSPADTGHSRPNVALALVQLAFVGLASPFLELAQDPFNGMIGLVILLVGIRIAWKLTAEDLQKQIVGPFKNAAAPQAPLALG